MATLARPRVATDLMMASVKSCAAACATAAGVAEIRYVMVTGLGILGLGWWNAFETTLQRVVWHPPPLSKLCKVFKAGTLSPDFGAGRSKKSYKMGAMAAKYS